MAHIEGTDRSQVLLLPEAVDDYVGADNPVRFVDAFVDGLDLEALGFLRARPKATGRPGYRPGDLLKLYIYGYLNRVRSSRRLEVEAHRNVEVIWLLRSLKPDFKTIADFRRDNRAAFKKVFREFVVLCRQLDLFGRELLAVDGTRIKAVNNRNKSFTKKTLAKFIEQADARLEKYLARLDEGDGVEAGLPGGGREDDLAGKIARIAERRDKLKGYLETLEKTGESQLSLTDPDSRSQARAAKVGVGYNAQAAVDAKHKLLAEQEVHIGVSDMGLLTETAVAAKETLDVEQIDVVADKGYFQAEDIEACEQAGAIPHVPKPERGPARRDGLFPKEDFVYDAVNDFYTCPGGQVLKRCGGGKLRETSIIHYHASPKSCDACALREQCTSSHGGRQVTRYENEALLESMAARLRARPELQNLRREIVEHPFGSIKQWMGQGTFLMRGLENVRAEFSLTALAYNIRRAITILGVPALIEAARA